MSELPRGWVEAPLKEICISLTDGDHQPPPKAQYGVPFITISAMNDGNVRMHKATRFVSETYYNSLSEDRRPRAGDILYSVTGSVGIAAPIRDDQPFVFQRHIAILRPNTEVVDRDYLLNYLRYPPTLDWLLAKATGTAQLTIPLGALRMTPVQLPPLPHQRRIASKLNSLFARTKSARHELDRLPLLIEHYKQAILEKAFTGELTADWREDRGRPDSTEVELRDVASDFSYGSAAKSLPEGNIPVLRMGNIQNGRLDWSDLVFSSNDEEIRKYALDPGDVLFNRTNSPELVGKTACYMGERPAIYAGYLIRVRCAERLNPQYFTYCLNSPEGRNYCWRVKTDGVSQSNINAKKLAAFSFRLPERDEQDEIVRRIKAAMEWLDVVAAEQGNAMRLLGHLDQRLLTKAFRAELVPQDPNDEPVEKLLERIRAAQAHEPKSGRNRRARLAV